MLKYLHENGCPWDIGTCHDATWCGPLHLDVLKYLKENGCPCDEETCAAAAVMGHLDVLKCLHENGFPWDYKTCFAAADNGHADVLRWAIDNNCPEPDTDTNDDEIDYDEYIEKKNRTLGGNKKCRL